MRSMGPFGFNALRYLAACLALIPPLVWRRLSAERRGLPRAPLGPSLLAGAGAGFFMFGGASLQQLGMLWTSAGKAGFITGLYVVLVPMLGIFLGRPSSLPAWIGAGLAAIGLYFLSMTGGLAIGRGDLLVLFGSFLWAGHILYIDRRCADTDPLALALGQFAVTSFLSFWPAFLAEGLTARSAAASLLPLLYSGFIAIGLGFTLQIIGQRSAQVTRASIVLSLESLFAALAGRVFLGERFTPSMILGAILIMAGMLLAQLGLGREARGASNR